MVRVKYSLLVKLAAFVIFAYFVIPSLFRISNQPSGPLDDVSNNEFGNVKNDKKREVGNVAYQTVIFYEYVK